MRRLASGRCNAVGAEELLRGHYAAERAGMQSPSEHAAAIEGCIDAIEFALVCDDVGSKVAGPAGRAIAERTASERYANAAIGYEPENSLGQSEDSLGSASRPSRMHPAKPHPASPSFLSFAALQARAIPLRVWAAQAAVVAFVLWACAAAPTEGFVNCAAAALGAIVAGMGAPITAASKVYRMAELEGACRFDCRSIAAARMAVVGAADVLLLGIAACTVPFLADVYALTFAVHACVPYFAVCAGSFAASRRARGASGVAVSAAMSAAVVGICALAQQVAPWAYESAAVGVWAIAAAVAGVWLAREAYAFLRATAEGIDAWGCIGGFAYNEKRCDISWN